MTRWLINFFRLCLALLLGACTGRPTSAPATDAPLTPTLAAPTAATGSQSLTGQIVFTAKNDIYIMNADGSGRTRLTTNLAADFDPAWSPDGTQIAFRSQRDGNDEIYVMQADGSQQTNLTRDPAGDWSPAWSADGRQIVFSSQRGEDAVRGVYVINLYGSGVANLTRDETEGEYPAWSPDGTRIAFACYQGGRDANLDYDICLMNADGSGQINLTQNAAYDMYPAWAPDGRRLAFYSERDGWPTLPDVVPPAYDATRGGNREIYVIDVPALPSGPPIAHNLTNNPAQDDSFPGWSQDGRIVFSREGCLSILSAEVPATVMALPGECDGNFPDWFQSTSTAVITPLPASTTTAGSGEAGPRSGSYAVKQVGDSGVTGVFEVHDIGDGSTELAITLFSAGDLNPWGIFDLEGCRSRPAVNQQPVITLPDIEQGTKAELVDSASFHGYPGRLVVVILDSANSGEMVACADLGTGVASTPVP